MSRAVWAVRWQVAPLTLLAGLLGGIAPARANPVGGADALTIGPGRGAGTRNVVSPPGERTPSMAPSPQEESPVPEPAPTHRRGKAPQEPSPTLPSDVPRPEVKDSLRRAIAMGPTADDLAAKLPDPQLLALHEAELVLFPRPLVGAVPGWSWDLPHATHAGPEVAASGTPPLARLEPSGSGVSSRRSDAAWLRSLTMPDLPVRLEPRVIRYLEFYRGSAEGRAIARAWARKRGRYVASIQGELNKQGLPIDLVWLSLIESGHNPTIKSPAGAAGLWQFVPETGRMYGLVVDRWVDERLDPLRSTQAAARFLSDLYQRFGSWELAMAAYNMGYGGVSRAIRKYNTNDFWELSRHEAGIPWETTLYVPKIMAIAIVMNNRQAFGIDDVVPDAPVSFDVVGVAPGTSLSRIAAAAEISVAEIEQLNPQYLVSRTPPPQADSQQSWRVRVPAGQGGAVQRRLARATGISADVEPYRVRFGDTIAAIAADLGTSDDKLNKLNGIADEERLELGTVLLVPTLPAGASPNDRSKPVVTVAPQEHSYPGRRRVFYEVAAGDDLDAIANALGVTRSELLAWNPVDPHARLQSGMVLQVFVPRSSALEDVRHWEADQVRVLEVGSEDFFDYHEGQRGRKRMLVVVAANDTLASIGKRYGMSVGSMERVNRRSRRDALTPGETVVVYAPQHTAEDPKARAGGSWQPLPEIEAPVPEALPAEGSPSGDFPSH